MGVFPQPTPAHFLSRRKGEAAPKTEHQEGDVPMRSVECSRCQMWASRSFTLRALDCFRAYFFSLFFFFNFIYLFIYLWLCWVFVSVRGLSPVAASGGHFITVRGPLTIAASPVAEHRLQTRRLSSCGSRAQPLRGMWDPPRPGLEPVSPALAGGLSTTAPPGKPPLFTF